MDFIEIKPIQAEIVELKYENGLIERKWALLFDKILLTTKELENLLSKCNEEQEIIVKLPTKK